MYSVGTAMSDLTGGPNGVKAITLVRCVWQYANLFHVRRWESLGRKVRNLADRIVTALAAP